MVFPNLWEEIGVSEETVVFLRDGRQVPMPRFETQDWRQRVEQFCAWSERMSLGDAALLDPERAAALDGTFRYLLLLFAGKTPVTELEHLSKFKRELELQDSRFSELLPVLVPWSDGDDGIESLRDTFQATVDNCSATALFDTTTRTRYAGPTWCGDMEHLRRFALDVLDDRVARIQSQAPSTGGAPEGVLELGSDFANLTQPLLVLHYAPWCAHSLNFVPLWHRLAAELRDTLPLAQLDGSRHEHPEIRIRAFPALLLFKAEGVIRYAGPAHNESIHAWIREQLRD